MKVFLKNQVISSIWINSFKPKSVRNLIEVTKTRLFISNLYKKPENTLKIIKKTCHNGKFNIK